MNTVVVEYTEKQYACGRIRVNGKTVGVGMDTYYLRDKPKRHWVAVLANDWNMSNPIVFHAPTIKGLLGQIKRHKYTLVQFRK